MEIEPKTKNLKNLQFDDTALHARLLDMISNEIDLQGNDYSPFGVTQFFLCRNCSAKKTEKWQESPMMQPCLSTFIFQPFLTFADLLRVKGWM